MTIFAKTLNHRRLTGSLKPETWSRSRSWDSKVVGVHKFLRVEVRAAFKNLIILPTPFYIDEKLKRIQMLNGTKSLRSLGPQIWNSLPEHIKTETSLAHFRSLINTWFGKECLCNLCKHTRTLNSTNY